MWVDPGREGALYSGPVVRLRSEGFLTGFLCPRGALLVLDETKGLVADLPDGDAPADLLIAEWDLRSRSDGRTIVPAGWPMRRPRRAGRPTPFTGPPPSALAGRFWSI